MRKRTSLADSKYWVNARDVVITEGERNGGVLQKRIIHLQNLTLIAFILWESGWN
jgi:hypothetical protein